MDTISAPKVAAQLGVTLPRLHRFLASQPGVSRNGNRILVHEETRQAAINRFGIIPRVEGLTRTETQVLVALSRRPRGLVSARQVASAARVSPTGASHALARLQQAGYVTVDDTTIFDGHVRLQPVYKVSWGSPVWRKVAPQLAGAVLPAAPAKATPRRVPARLANVFWTGDTTSIDVTRHPAYTARRIINEGRHHPEGLAFLGNLPSDAVRQALETADPPVRARG